MCDLEYWMTGQSRHEPSDRSAWRPSYRPSNLPPIPTTHIRLCLPAPALPCPPLQVFEEWEAENRYPKGVITKVRC